MSTIVEPDISVPMRGMNPLYPCCDGKPMAENSLQADWIMCIKGNLDALFQDQPDVWVAADNLIYPVKLKPKICSAPDVYVVFGRPKEHRGSYIVHEEENIFPQVVFEIRSQNNTAAEMADKLVFYEKYGAKEYYDYDPKKNRIHGYVRRGSRLRPIAEMNGWKSPQLGIHFDLSGEEMELRLPNGERFKTFSEIKREVEEAKKQVQRMKRDIEKTKKEATQADDRAKQADERAKQADERATQAARETARLKALLKAAGIDPAQV